MTPEEQNLLTQVEQGINASVTYPNQFAACDLYEAFLLMLIVEAAVREGGSTEIRDRSDNPTAALVLRSGPGSIYSNSAPYTHVHIEFPGKPPLEVHLGIYIAGLSSVVHECDIAVLDAAEARNCRMNSSHPDRNALLIGVECKYYTTSLGIDLIRSFLGLTDELKRKNRFFVSNTGGDNPKKILARHEINWSTNLSPGEVREITKIRSLFETIFQNYKVL